MYVDSTIPAWITRETARFHNKEYSYIPWDIVRHFSAQIPNNHFLHISTDRPGMVAYVQSDKHGQQDRQTRTKLGKYLNKYTDLAPSLVADLAAKLRGHTTVDNGLHWARTRDEIRKVYSGSPASCMTHAIDSYDTEGVHPCEPYATPDIAVAYPMRDGNINSRSVVNMLDSKYVRLYGDYCVLQDLLEAAGYSGNGDLAGCRLLRIEANSSYVMPYLDGGSDAIDYHSEDYLIVTDGYSGDAGTADSTCGLLEDEDRVMCECCDEHTHVDNTMCDVNSNTICESCADREYVSFNCELYREDELSDHNLVQIDGDVHDMDDCVYCEDISEYVLHDDAVSYIDSYGDYHYQSDHDGIVQDELTGENILASDANEYEVAGDTRYTLSDPMEDQEYADEQADEE